MALPILTRDPARRSRLLTSRLRVIAYLCAVLGPALMVASKQWLIDVPGEAPFLLLLGQVALAGAIGGLFPALLGTLVSALAVTYLLLPPSQSFAIEARDTDRVLLFLVEGLVVSAIVGFLHRSWHQTRHVLAATRAADDRVRAAWQMRTRFYTEATHDIRQPLSRLVMQLQLARRQLTTADVGSPLAMRLDASIKAARALSLLMTDLLESARLEIDVVAGPRERLDLALLVKEVCAEFADGPDASPFEIEAPTQEIWIKGDRIALSRVLRNLLDNALKYGGGRTILVETTIAASQREALVRVSDQGIGIPAAERDRIFEPFYRASNVDSTTGHGLGLSISRRIVEQHVAVSGSMTQDRTERLSHSPCLSRTT
jgi:signal transduction histidine kinase